MLSSGSPRLEDVVLRILHLETGVTRTRLDHASQDHLLARLEDLVQIGLVEPNGGQVVAAVEQDHFEQLHPLSGRDGHALREDLARHCLEPSGPEIADRLEPAPVLIPPGKESQQIGHGLDADPAEQLGASRADPFHVLDLGLPGDAHPRRRLGRRSRGGMPRSIGLSRLGRRPPMGEGVPAFSDSSMMSSAALARSRRPSAGSASNPSSRTSSLAHAASSFGSGFPAASNLCRTNFPSPGRRRGAARRTPGARAGPRPNPRRMLVNEFLSFGEECGRFTSHFGARSFHEGDPNHATHLRDLRKKAIRSAATSVTPITGPSEDSGPTFRRSAPL